MEKKLDGNPTDESDILKDMKEKVAYLEDKNCTLKDEIDELLNRDYVQTFQNGRYTKEVRQVYYELLSMNVGVRNCEKVVRTVLEKLGKRGIDRLPTKSVASMMMVESRLLAQIQTTEAMLSGDRNALHLDGTKLRFEELGSFQVVTESGSYSMSVEDMLSGEGECYYDTFRDVLTEMAGLIVPDNQVEQKVRELLFSIKNIMTDRAITNKKFVDHLSSWRSDILPFVIEKFDDLPDHEKAKFTRMNHLFCGLHVVHNMGLYAETAMREWLKIVCLTEKHGGFTTSNSRVYDLLFEISKLCSYTHGDQRNGKAPYWEAALDKKGCTNKITSFLHHRFNVYFVLGGAVYYHLDDLKEFLPTLETENFLVTSIRSDLNTKVYIAGFRALGIFNKLVSGPVYRKVEEKVHIFSLNPMWNDLKVKLDRCSKNAHEMLSGEALLENDLSKDVVFDTLFAETNDPELDLLTQECLELICCCCVTMINRQLKDQLPGGKYHQPSTDVMEETEKCHTTNILSERDFAQMDRKVKQKQNISTIGASGVIMFMNNKTGLWLNEKTQKEQEDLISKVVHLTPERIKAYQEKRKDLLRARQDKMEKKKLDAEVQTQKKSDEKEKLTKKVEEFGGLWGSSDKVDEQLSCLPAKQHRAAIVSQIDFRKVVLEQVPPDRIIGQKGRTVDGKRVEFSVGELTTNLKTFIEFQAKTVLSQVEVRPREERREKLEEAKKEITSIMKMRMMMLKRKKQKRKNSPKYLVRK